MSAHVEEKLWAHARGELGAAEAGAVEEHVKACAECASVLARFRAARALVRPAEPPALDDEAWRRIDARVMAAARKELSAPASPFDWLSGRWRPFAVAGALAAAAAMAWALLSPAPAPVQQQQVAVVEPPALEQGVEEPPRAPAAVNPQVAPPAEEPALTAVASAADSRVDGATITQGIQLRAGQRLSTGKRGQAFLALPDGSRAGLVGEGGLLLAAASPKEVRLDLDRGTLVVAASHRGPERTFRVAAGEVEVFVVGTRFLVERAERVTVVVEEGKVEVAVGGRRHPVGQGETLLVDDRGEVSRRRTPPGAKAAFLALAGEPAPTARVPLAAAPPEELSAQRLTEEDDAVPPPEEAAPPDARVDGGEQVAIAPPTPPPLFVPADPAQSAEPKKDARFDLFGALKRINLKNINLDSPYPPVGMPVSEYRVHQLQRNADRGQCDRVLEGADEWMAQFAAAPDVKDRPALTRAVLFTKARCLTKLGRAEEAEKVRAQLEAVR